MEPKTTQTRTQTPLVFRAYQACVVAMLVCYALFVLLPFVQTGAWTISSRELWQATGPAYPFGGLAVLMAMLSGLFAPIVSFPPLFVWGSMLTRGATEAWERRALLPAVIAHVLFMGFALTYGQTILAWILD